MSDHTYWTMRDRDESARALRAGRELGALVPVTYFFSSPGVYPAPALQALRSMGIDHISVDEEMTGDGFWHVAAFTIAELSEAAISEANAVMGSVAARAGVEYDGWTLTLTVGEERELLR
jgi:hypothetical protein